MFSIKVNFSLTDANRTKSIKGDSYRPLLYFPNGVIRSGLIELSNGEVLDMTSSYENKIIKIYFYKDLDIASVFFVNNTFNLCEGSSVIGYGVIVEVLGEDKS